MAKGLTVNKNPGKRELTGGQSLAQLSEKIRALKGRVPVWMAIDAIPVMDAFENLFCIKIKNLESIKGSIQTNGFDEKFAVIIGAFPDGTRSLIAGFTRKKAAAMCQLDQIPAWTQEFESVEAAIEWALHEQYDRRNLSDDEIYESVLRIDEFSKNGTYGFGGKSSLRTADIAGISARKVEQIRTVDKTATEEQKEAIRTGDKSINGIYQEIKGKSEKAQHCANSRDSTEPEQERAPCGAPEKAQSCANQPVPERNWSLEIRGANVILVRKDKDEEMVLINFSAMNLLYNGAPEKKLLKVVEEYMEKVL